MARDSKVIQRGINVQGNDLAVPSGTMTDAKNLAFDRDGVAATRRGFYPWATGLPTNAFEASSADAAYGANRNFYDVFSGNVCLHLHGVPFVFDETTPGLQNNFWLSVPVNIPHRLRLHGGGFAGLGLMVINTGTGANQLEWQSDNGSRRFFGAIGNNLSAATDATATQDTKFRTAFDVVTTTNGKMFISDDTNIRSAATAGTVPTLLAGSITLSGATDGTTTAARFNGASWMATDGTDLYVVDNTNEIRKVTQAGVVTTFAGSITAGDTDGTGTAARFRNISGICYDSTTAALYVSEGTAAHRIRKVTVPGAVVSIFAGALTPTSGNVDAVGTAARFNTPNGIEAATYAGVAGSALYVGDTNNNAIRRIDCSTASVTTYVSSTSPNVNTGMVPGALNFTGVSVPSVTVRGKYTYSAVTGFAAGTYISFECQAPNSSTDIGMVRTSNASTEQPVMHLARCPNSLPVAISGPNKLDAWGVSTYALQDVRMTDVAGGVVMTTSEQPRMIDAYTRVGYADPMPRMRQLGITWPEAPSVTSTTGTVFAANTAVAYRVLPGLRLPNGRLAFGAPSERIVTSSITTWAGSITAYAQPANPYDGLPFVQIYRTKAVANTLDPGDQMFLAYEAPITYGQGLTVTDICPDELLGAELYTNQTQFGLASSSLPPPGFANEVASFNQQVVLADFIPVASCRIQVLGVTALVSGTSTLTLTTTGATTSDACNTLTINFNSSATDPLIKRAQIATGGSAATNAVQTARNIVRVINRCPDAFMFRAIYDESDPGAFVVYSQYPGSSKSKLSPTDLSLGVGSLTQVALTFSTNSPTQFIALNLTPSQRQQNAFAFSDSSDPDSFPIINTGKLGPSEEPFVRMLPISETLLAVKRNTIWRCDPDYNFQIYDTTLTCTAPNSFAKLNDQWFGLFGQGFRALTSSSPNQVGRPIDRRVTSLFTTPRIGSNSFNQFSSDLAYGASIDRNGVYLCSFNGTLFSYDAYGGGSWGTYDTVVGTPTMLGKHKDDFWIGFDTVNGVAWQASRRNFQGALISSYNLFFTDLALSASVTSVFSTRSVSAQIPDATVNPCGIGNSSINWAGAVIVGPPVLIGAIIISGTGTNANPWILDADMTLNVGDTITIALPIEVRAQYAPFYTQDNTQFQDVVATIERATRGSITGTWYNRRDTLNLAVASLTSVVPYGQYGSDNGITRTDYMPDFSSSLLRYCYYDLRRFATPSDRSNDQVSAFALSFRQAYSPIAIKSVKFDGAVSADGKVKQ